MMANGRAAIDCRKNQNVISSAHESAGTMEALKSSCDWRWLAGRTNGRYIVKDFMVVRHVMQMHVVANLDVGRRHPNGLAVLNNRLTSLDGLDRDFVAPLDRCRRDQTHFTSKDFFIWRNRFGGNSNIVLGAKPDNCGHE